MYSNLLCRGCTPRWLIPALPKSARLQIATFSSARRGLGNLRRSPFRMDALLEDEAIGLSMEIQLEARDLPNMDFGSLSDPFAVLDIRKDSQWIEFGRTETIWDVLNPKWVRSFSLPPETPRSTLFRIYVYDRDTKSQELARQEVIGSAIASVHDILVQGSAGKTLQLENNKLKEPGSITIIGELYDETDADHQIFLGTCKFRNSSLFGMFLSRPYIAIYRRRPNNEWAPIFRSKPINKGEDAAFNEDILRHAKIRTYNKRGSCEETPLRIELRSHRAMADHKLIGAVQMSLGSLRRQPLGKKISLGLAGESVGELTITRATLADDSSSFDLEVSFCSK